MRRINCETTAKNWTRFCHLAFAPPSELQIDLVYQCRRLHGVSRSLVPKTLNCQPVEFIVNPRDELSSSLLIAVSELVERRRYIYRRGIQVALRKPDLND